jgi:hypothetical protein
MWNDSNESTSSIKWIHAEKHEKKVLITFSKMTLLKNFINFFKILSLIVEYCSIVKSYKNVFISLYLFKSLK